MSAPNLNALMTGYWLSQVVYVIAKLNLADLLHKKPQTADELAAATGTNRDALYRLLRTSAGVGLVQEDGEHRFHLQPLAEPLRSGVPGSQRALAIMTGEEHFVSWSELLYSVQT